MYDSPMMCIHQIDRNPLCVQAIPLFVTSLSVPFLVVVLRVIRSSDGHDTRLSAGDATK